jgi:glyoxylase-like metal-dependent hydrolase (beta-lactamase superfamily II)
MESNRTTNFITRREMLQAAATFAGGALLARFYPATLVHAAAAGFPQQGAAADPVAAMRAQFGGTPIQAQKLADNITLLMGPGGNVVVLDGADGKLLVDNFVSPAWPKLKETLDGISKAPVKTAIDTHWHFDHTDNNASLRAAGATVLAHDNTRKRMSEAHTLAVLNLSFPASPAAALPQQTFKDSRKLQVNGENVTLMHVPPAHTDSDIYVYFQKANVLQTGDIFFNGIYPYIDPGTGGNISGVIASADKILAVADNNTKIVPGHGPLGNKADVVKYRDMLITVRDRIQKLKSSGKSMQEAVAAKALADLDPVWGKAFFNGDAFTQIVYLSL